MKITHVITTSCSDYTIHTFIYCCFSQLFDYLKEKKGVEILNKIYPIAGDVSELNLAISESDRRMLADTVQIVYHAAATIRFDEALKKAVLLNTRGTKLVLDLAKEMKNLEVKINSNSPAIFFVIATLKSTKSKTIYL